MRRFLDAKKENGLNEIYWVGLGNLNVFEFLGKFFASAANSFFHIYLQRALRIA